MSTNKKKISTKSKRKVKTKNKNYLVIYMVVLSLCTIFLGIFMYVTGDGGIVSDAVKYGIYGTFGRTGILLPVFFAGLTIYLGKTKDVKKFWCKTVLSILLLVNTSSLSGLYNSQTPGNAFYLGANSYEGGGAVGAAVAYIFKILIKSVASYVVLSITLLVIASVLTNVNIFAYIVKFTKGATSGVKKKYAEHKEKYAYDDDDDDDEYILTNSRKQDKEKSQAVAAADDFAKDMPNKKKSERSVKKAKASDKTDNKEVKAEADKTDVFSDGIDEFFETFNSEAKPDSKEDIKHIRKRTEKVSVDNGEKEIDKKSDDEKEKADKISEAEKEKYNKELNAAIEKTAVKYVFPPISILNDTKNGAVDHRDEMRRTAEKLINILDDFGVKAKLLQVTQGPTVTRYEIQPEVGTKLSKIVGLADDLALNLAVSTVLVAPVPGKAAVGVEIPNKKVTSVAIREMIKSSEFVGAKSKLTVALGKDIGGNVVVGDISKWPHVLIAGATGSGKSVCINTIITSILYKASPEDIKLIMVDPKVVELGVYNGIPHLLIPVVTDPKKAAGALNWAVTEMMRRYDLFKDTGVRKLESYNKLMQSTGGEKIPQLVIIIDELADLMMVAAKEVEDYVCRLAQLARAAGIHLVIATQRPSVDVITGLIKANIPSRIAFAVSSQVDSRTILDKGGAEKLLGMGDMLYYPTGSRTATRVQGAFVSDEEIERIIEFIKDNMGETHYSEDLAEQIERCSSGENGVTPDVSDDGDVLLPDAIELAFDLGKISTSMIQRRLGVGYSRAGRIIDQMETRGIISGANGSKPRDVLVSRASIETHSLNDESDDIYEDDDNYDDNDIGEDADEE